MKRSRCSDARTLLASYVEGELNSAERDRVGGHLQMCADCEREAGIFRAALSALSAVEPVPAPRELYAGFAAKLELRSGTLRPGRLHLRLAAAAALMLLVGLVGAAPYIRDLMMPHTAGRLLATVKTGVQAAPESSSLTVKREMPADKVAADNPKPTSDSKGEIVEPDPFDSKVLEKPKRITKQVPDAPVDFLDVKPRAGLGARQQFAARRTVTREAEIRPREVTPLDNRVSAITSKETGFIRERDERIQIGNAVTTVRTGYRLDEEGERASVDINIGTATVPQ